MSLSTIQRGVSVYRQWRTRLAQAVDELDTWLANDPGVDAKAARQIQAARERIRGDRLALAVVAARHSDAVALVNALLFVGLERPLLPINATSPVGCPMTFFWDERRNAAYLRLLPDEPSDSRLPPTADADVCRDWIEHPLAGRSAEQQGAGLREILAFQTSSQTAGPEPGPTNPDPAATGPIPDPPQRRKWRRALVSLAHPLLEQGLRVTLVASLDDLERVGDAVNQAQAVALVLPAKSADMLAGQRRRIKALAAKQAQSLVVVLNEGDTAAQTALGAAGSAAAPAEHGGTLSATFGLPPEQVVSVAVQQAVNACLDGDQARLRASALPSMERTLATLLLQAKRRAVIATLETEIGQLIKDRRSQVSAELARSQTQLQELETLHGKSRQVSVQLFELTRRQREQYLRAVLRFQEEREQLLSETQRCRELLARENIDRIVVAAHKRMVRCWTTYGLSLTMKGLFDTLRQRMQGVADESERLRKLVRSMYAEFHADYDFELSLPKVFVPTRYHVELELLYQEVETFRHSRGMRLTEQAGVIERFHERMVSRARVLFEQLSTSLDPWIRDSLQPIADAIHEHQAAMEQRLTSLKRLERSNQGLEERIEAQRAQRIELIRRLTALRNVQNTLFQLPLVQDPFVPPRLVAGLG